MRLDIVQPLVNRGHADTVGRLFQLRQQAGPLDIGGQDVLKRRLCARRGFLRHGSDAGIAAMRNFTGFQRKLAQNGAQ